MRRQPFFARRHAAVPLLVLALLWGEVQGAEVFLRSLTIYNTHDILTDPEIYFACEGSEQQQSLGTVKKKDKLYEWGAGAMLLMSIDGTASRSVEPQCRTCRFFDMDRFPYNTEDVLGEFPVCHDSFQGDPPGAMQVFKQGEFLASLECLACVSPSPPPPSAPPPPLPPSPPPAGPDDYMRSAEWRFVSGPWRGTQQEDTSSSTAKWEVVAGWPYESRDCSGEPLEVVEVEFLKCCGLGPWPGTTATESSSGGGGGSEEMSGGEDGDSEKSGNSSDGTWKESLEAWDRPGPFNGTPSFARYEGYGCKDFTHMFVTETTEEACRAQCGSWPTCGAFTFNTLHSKCYLKETCLDLRLDEKGYDISGVKGANAEEDEADDGAQIDETAEDRGVADSIQEAIDNPRVRWEFNTRSVEDSSQGGASVIFRLSSPAVVRCMQFLVPPGNTSHFPGSGYIEYGFSQEEAGVVTWRRAQNLMQIRQEQQPLKLLSDHVDTTSLSAEIPAELPHGPKSIQEAPEKAANGASGSLFRIGTLIVMIVICAVFFALGMAVFALHGRYKAAKQLRYERRFEEVFDSPEFEELDDIVESDEQGFLASLLDRQHWAPGGRYCLRQSPPEDL